MVTKSTLIRTILVIIVLINFILERIGVKVINTDENTVAMVVETAIEVGIIIAGFWKNNSYTKAALKADEFLKKLKESE